MSLDVKSSTHESQCDYSVSVYYAESRVAASLSDAWKAVLNFKAWNPSFAGAVITPVSGDAEIEGGVVRISKTLLDIQGQPLPRFFVQTVKFVPQSHIAWYAYPEVGNDFRIFIDFAVREAGEGVIFNAYYYEQNRYQGEVLASHRHVRQQTLDILAQKFKEYCELKR